MQAHRGSRPIVAALSVLLALAAVPSRADDQDPPRHRHPRHDHARDEGDRNHEKGPGVGPTVALDGGMGVGGSSTGAIVGGSVRLDAGERLGVEASGRYLGGREGGVSALASLLVNLRRPREKAVPYVAVGGGIFHWTEGSRFGDGRFGDVCGEGRGCAGEWAGMMGQWLGMMGYRGQPASWPQRWDGMDEGRRHSTDPALSVGGGIRIDLGHQLALIPDARALLVFDGGTHTIGTLTVSLGYRF